MIVFCSACHRDLPAGVTSCPHCHTPVQTARRSEISSLGEQGTLGTASCPRCGSPQDPVSGVCPICSPAATGTSSGTPQDKQQEYVELDFEQATAPSTAPANKGPGTTSTTAALRQIQPGGSFRCWDLTRPYYSVGREGAKISLPDRHVSRRHLAVAQVGPDWLVINRSDKGMRVNGEALTQKTLRSGDILRIGQTWLVFAAGKAASPGKSLRSMAGRLVMGSGTRTAGPGTLEAPEDEVSETAQVRLLTGNRLVASSTGQPLLLGSHPLCAVRLSGTGIAPVHALLAWLLDGLHLLDLDSGRGTLLDGQPIRDSLVRDGQTVTVGEQTLTVRLAGDPCSPALSRASRRRNTPRNVALTVIYGPHTGETALLPLDRPVRLGSSAEDDLGLPREQLLAGGHLELKVIREGDKKQPSGQVLLRDLNNRGDIHVNREAISGSVTAAVGDVIQFGQPTPCSPTALLLHYDPCLDGW